MHKTRHIPWVSQWGASVALSCWDRFSRSHFYTHSYTPHGAPGGHPLESFGVPDSLPCVSASEPTQKQANIDRDGNKQTHEMIQALKHIRTLLFTPNGSHLPTMSKS